MIRKAASILAAGTLALALAACASMMGNQLNKDADELRTALAGEPVAVTTQDSSVIIASSADYLYPSGGWQLRPGAPLLSKMGFSRTSRAAETERCSASL
jgi:hypothetical protein